MKTLTCLIALLLVSGTLLATEPTKKDEKQAVEQAVEKLKKGIIDADESALSSITADQLTYGHSNGLLEDKTAFIKALVTKESDFVTIDLTDQTISIVDNTAWVRHKLSGTTNNKNVAGKVSLSVLLVWVKQKGDWKLLARQAVKI
ncbi:nuclear transport factor 2 family protein [Larkinella rosea]|uniref:Nuclear transport factor 2 family protein n=1 Tax=Larkinella rosea TaxID=2025312 RepID=A0A3P1B915_9BACT|nr:nuclear transport factor 2 family protein [Larkinella rosea]RRA97570.1 nuclear transport factor 2 family protein [Larkinella rosea]